MSRTPITSRPEKSGTTISERERLLQAIWPGNFSTSGTIIVRASAEEIRANVHALKLAQTSIKSNKEMQQSIMQIEGLERDAVAAENRALALAEDEIPVLYKIVPDPEETHGRQYSGRNLTEILHCYGLFQNGTVNLFFF